VCVVGFLLYVRIWALYFASNIFCSLLKRTEYCYPLARTSLISFAKVRVRRRRRLARDGRKAVEISRRFGELAREVTGMSSPLGRCGRG
jgi:hypothetical protein